MSNSDSFEVVYQKLLESSANYEVDTAKTARMFNRCLNNPSIIKKHSKNIEALVIHHYNKNKDKNSNVNFAPYKQSIIIGGRGMVLYPDSLPDDLKKMICFYIDTSIIDQNI